MSRNENTTRRTQRGKHASHRRRRKGSLGYRLVIPSFILVTAGGLSAGLITTGSSSASTLVDRVSTPTLKIVPNRDNVQARTIHHTIASLREHQLQKWARWRRAREARARAAAAAPPTPQAPTGATPPANPPTGTTPPAGFTACVIRTESGGDPTAYNSSSGASGLFGMLLSTWLSAGVGYSGGAYTAPSSVQYQAFDIIYARSGTSPWEPYDGCSLSSTSAIRAKLLSASVPRRLIAAAWARSVKGCWYSFGGTSCSPGFDCSGLVMMSWLHAGIHLPRTTYDMLHSWHLVPIPESQARKGDLAFFGSGHVELVWYEKNGVVRYTYGAREPGIRVGAHLDVYFRPTAYYRVR